RQMNTFDAETSLLGSILIDGSLFADLEIDEQYFTHKQHQLIFQAMRQAYKEKGAIDLVIVTTVLGERIEAAGGVMYLTEMAESVPSTATFKQYEHILKEAYQLKEAKRAVQRFLNQPTEQTMDQLLKDLTTCRELTATQSEKSTYSHLMEISEELLEPESDHLGYMTSLTDFDQMTGGLQRGDLIIL